MLLSFVCLFVFVEPQHNSFLMQKAAKSYKLKGMCKRSGGSLTCKLDAEVKSAYSTM